ncbi:MAG: heavy metal translocating P-type ATPase, partial [Desulfurococcaceae archaeon]
MFVGDGVNDVLTIREAFVGIAMGKASDIAKNGGDVVSIFNDMRDVVEIHELSGKVNGIALENLTWVFAYNAMLIPM